jgi:hypothetical protein
LNIKIHRTIILPVVLYGCEILTLALREEPKLRMFMKTVLRRIFGECGGRLKKKHNEELYNLCVSKILLG